MNDNVHSFFVYLFSIEDYKLGSIRIDYLSTFYLL